MSIGLDAARCTFCLTKQHNMLYRCFMINGTEIRKRRDALGYSQDDLAKLAGVHVNTVKGMEAGIRDHSVGTLESIARALRCEMADLVKPNQRRKSA